MGSRVQECKCARTWFRVLQVSVILEVHPIETLKCSAWICIFCWWNMIVIYGFIATSIILLSVIVWADFRAQQLLRRERNSSAWWSKSETGDEPTWVSGNGDILVLKMQKEGRKPFFLGWAGPCLAKQSFAFGFEFINLMGKYKKAGQEFFLLLSYSTLLFSLLSLVPFL
jgi:hypothetical protein